MSRHGSTAALEDENRRIGVLIVAESAARHAELEAMLREGGRFEAIQSDLRTVKLEASALSGTAVQADVVLIDAGSKLLASLPLPSAGYAPTIVLLIDEISRGELIRALHSGVRALLRHDWKQEELLAAIEAVAMGFTALGPEELELLLPTDQGDGHEQIFTEALSARESEVLALMSQGMANKKIADQLGISEHTVKFHVSSILSKLGAASRTEAVTRGLRDGLIVV